MIGPSYWVKQGHIRTHTLNLLVYHIAELAFITWYSLCTFDSFEYFSYE